MEGDRRERRERREGGGRRERRERREWRERREMRRGRRRRKGEEVVSYKFRDAPELREGLKKIRRGRRRIAKGRTQRDQKGRKKTYPWHTRVNNFDVQRCL
jgi:hypothetical protein